MKINLDLLGVLAECMNLFKCENVKSTKDQYWY